MAVAAVVTVVNLNSFSDRPFVGVGNSVGRVWAKRFLLCPCAVHGVIHAHKWLRTLYELWFSTVSIAGAWVRKPFDLGIKKATHDFSHGRFGGSYGFVGVELSKWAMHLQAGNVERDTLLYLRLTI